MRIHVVRTADIPYGGDVYVHRGQEQSRVIWLDEDVFTQADASILSERLRTNPGLLLAFGVAAA